MGKQMITGLEPGEVAGYVFLCGEPERVPKIASILEDGKKLRQAREYLVYGGTLDGTQITVASTGIGGPSAAILVEELANLGAHTFIRIGTSGGIADDLEKGDFVIATGAIRADGTSRSYAWTEYPALANHEVVMALIDSATRKKVRFDAGICFSVDGFYSENKVISDGKIQPMSHSNYMTSTMISRLGDVKKMQGKNIEMENGTIFTVCSLFGLRAGAICTVSDVVPWHPTEKILDFEQNMSECIAVGVDAMKTLISWDRKKQGKRFYAPSLG
ncbi:MAG: nucleoside phosphorylase [Thermoplasmata archaeon]|nr:nucleoside phosphorylase [Thermoplasmata archaeon]MBU1157724.1 nucleoside phosphorylase [Candidatus Thermoplasmatota archaeon]TFG68996.1 MAG: uridine phosphorylase [Methanomassiliicoccus sp.]